MHRNDLSFARCCGINRFIGRRKKVKIIKIISLLSALPLLAIGLPATAQTDLTCDDITFGYEMTSKFPEIGDACQDVVEVDGERFAKMSVEIIRTNGNRATFRFKMPDGSYGPTQSTELDPSWRAEIQGRNMRLRDLGRGQELNIYLPADRWEAHVATNMTGYFAVYYPVAMEEDSGGGASLPSTASFMPMFGLLGGAALFSAFLIRVFRRR
jgi:hypothetical protein